MKIMKIIKIMVSESEKRFLSVVSWRGILKILVPSPEISGFGSCFRVFRFRKSWFSVRKSPGLVPFSESSMMHASILSVIQSSEFRKHRAWFLFQSLQMSEILIQSSEISGPGAFFGVISVQESWFRVRKSPGLVPLSESSVIAISGAGRLCRPAERLQS